MTSWLVFKRICGGKVNWETNTNIISGPKGPVFLKDLHMTQNKQSWLLLAGLLATGCTGIESGHSLGTREPISSFQQQAIAGRQQLIQTPAVPSLNKLTYQPLNEENKWIQIGSNNQVFSFETGKSYLTAFSLPNQSQAIHIKLTVPVDFSLFLPSVMILDENFATLQVVPSSKFAKVGDDLMAGQNLKGEFTVPVTIGSSRPAYMLIYTTTQDMQSTTKINSDVLQRAMQHDRTTDVARFLNSEVPHAATGRLHLTFDYQTDLTAAPSKQYVSPAATTLGSVNPMSEQGYYQRIRDAVAKKEYEKALALVQAAKKAGFTHAQDVFFAAQQ